VSFVVDLVSSSTERLIVSTFAERAAHLGLGEDLLDHRLQLPARERRAALREVEHALAKPLERFAWSHRARRPRRSTRRPRRSPRRGSRGSSRRSR
jgi:hypothetical protein